jgi:hypothetical protein
MNKSRVARVTVLCLVSLCLMIWLGCENNDNVVDDSSGASGGDETVAGTALAIAPTGPYYFPSNTWGVVFTASLDSHSPWRS